MPPISNGLTNPQIIERCHALLEEMEDLMIAMTPLTSDEISRMTKVRPDPDRLVTDVLRLCQAAALTRVGDGPTLGEVEVDFDDARALRALLERHDRARARIHAWRLRTECGAWSAVLTFYATLKRLANRDAALDQALAPVRAFFVRGRRPRPSLVVAGPIRPSRSSRSRTPQRRKIDRRFPVVSPVPAAAPGGMVRRCTDLSPSPTISTSPTTTSSTASGRA